MGIYYCGSFTQELSIKNEDAMVLLIAWYFLCYVPIFKASRMLVEKQCTARGLHFSLSQKENKGRINCDTLSDFLPHIIIYTTLYFHQEALIYAPQFSSYITVLPYFLGLDCVDCIQKGDSFSPHNNSQQQRKTPFYINVSPKKSFGFIGHPKKMAFQYFHLFSSLVEQ